MQFHLHRWQHFGHVDDRLACSDEVARVDDGRLDLLLVLGRGFDMAHVKGVQGCNPRADVQKAVRIVAVQLGEASETGEAHLPAGDAAEARAGRGERARSLPVERRVDDDLRVADSIPAPAFEQAVEKCDRPELGADAVALHVARQGQRLNHERDQLCAARLVASVLQDFIVDYPVDAVEHGCVDVMASPSFQGTVEVGVEFPHGGRDALVAHSRGGERMYQLAAAEPPPYRGHLADFVFGAFVYAIEGMVVRGVEPDNVDEIHRLGLLEMIVQGFVVTQQVDEIRLVPRIRGAIVWEAFYQHGWWWHYPRFGLV